MELMHTLLHSSVFTCYFLEVIVPVLFVVKLLTHFFQKLHLSLHLIAPFSRSSTLCISEYSDPCADSSSEPHPGV